MTVSELQQALHDAELELREAQKACYWVMLRCRPSVIANLTPGLCELLEKHANKYNVNSTNPMRNKSSVEIGRECGFDVTTGGRK